MLKVFLWASLLMAFLYGQLSGGYDYEHLLSQRFAQEGNVELLTQNDQYSLYNLKHAGTGAIVVSEGKGYGGKLIISSSIESGEKRSIISDVDLLKDFETQAYVEKLKKKYFFRQFLGKSVSDDFVLGRDIDSYSGATVTARAVVQAVRKGVHGYAISELGLPRTWKPPQWKIGLGEVSTFLLVFVALITSLRLKKSFLRIVKVGLPFASLVFVGFYNNASISLGSLGSILLGYLPDFRGHTIWWLMMGGVFCGILVIGRNIYCEKLCPFSAVQFILNSISGINWKVPRVVSKNSRKVILGMMWLGMMLIFISKHPSVGSYEPFSMMFSLDGYGLQWYILPLALFGSIFVPEFWCRLFCPVGLALNESVKLRRKVMNNISIRKIDD